jgi:2-haloalkanoic acid dehalogenase type II
VGDVGRLYEYVTFDCYGTLVDWEAGIWSAFQAAAVEHGVRLEREPTLAAHAEIEPIVEAGPYRSYRDVLQETARRVARRFDWELTEEQAAFLPQSLERWRAFPDTAPALSRLAAAGYRLGILSNVDTDLLDRTLRQFEVSFDLLVTAQEVGAYKPSFAHFLATRQRVGGALWLHVAQSWFHDVVPAGELGVPVAWINRKDEPAGEGGSPVRIFPTLSELADWLTPPSG